MFRNQTSGPPNLAPECKPLVRDHSAATAFLARVHVRVLDRPRVIGAAKRVPMFILGDLTGLVLCVVENVSARVSLGWANASL